MKNWMKNLMNAVLVMAFVVPMTTSCYDDSALWKSIDSIQVRLDSLTASLDNQMKAMSSIMSKMTTITNCVQKSDGTYEITLSDGTSFKVLPKGMNFSSIITYREVAGKKYWATIGPDGKLVDLTDKNGNPIPVEAEGVKVETKLVEGKYYIVIDGQEFLTGYNAEDVVQVFSSCVPLKDASGNIYAMKFSFGEGLDVTVTVDGYKGVLFKLTNGGAVSVVNEYFVKYGTVQTFELDCEGIIDYVMQIPDGWRVSEREDEVTGVTYVDVKAPSAELVASGAAVAKGDLKVVSVVEGGKAAVTKLTLSAEPFKTYDVTSVRATVVPYAGVQKFVYGLSTIDEYDEAALLAQVTEILTTSMDIPAGFGVSEAGINATLAEIYGKELSTEERYVFWVIPAMYSEGETAGFYVEEGTFLKYEFGAVIVTISQPVAALLDAEVEVTMKGLASCYAGTSLLDENFYENLIYSINNGIIDPVSPVPSYKGSAFAFPDVKEDERIEVEPATTYVTWVVPVEEGKTTYTVDDVIRKEFTTKAVAAGGSLETVLGTPEVSHTTISVPVEAAGAQMIYYTYLSSTAGGRLAADGVDNDSRVQMILSDANCVKVNAASAVATVTDVKPNTTMWLFAVSVDAEGKYGKASFVSAKTTPVTYNSLSVTVNTVDVSSDEAILKVEVTGGTPTEFIYWVGKTTDSFWANTAYCGATKSSAQEYMASHPDHEQIVRSMNANPLSADGTLTATELMMETDYVVMVLAKDESGKYSKGGYKKFTTLAADLGVVVREGSDQWTAVKNQVKLEWIDKAFLAAENSQMMASYAFNFSCPQEYTAFVMCASENYFVEAGLTKKEHIMIDIQNYASRKYDNGYLPYDDQGNMMTEPDYYKDGELKQGQLMNVYDYYVHGLPALGFVTYFGKGAHGEDNCIYWENGHDAAYERALTSIAQHRTITPYRERAEAFGLKGKEAEDWAAALLEAYLPFYKDVEPIIYENDGVSSVKITNPYATGKNEDGIVPDRVFVLLRDAAGNYFEPMSFEVPDLFK